jgi:hypothetical protein
MAGLIVTDDKEPYGIVQDSLSDPNDHASGFEAGNAGQYNDNSKSLEWQRGWADSHRRLPSAESRVPTPASS